MAISHVPEIEVKPEAVDVSHIPEGLLMELAQIVDSSQLGEQREDMPIDMTEPDSLLVSQLLSEATLGLGMDRIIACGQSKLYSQVAKTKIRQLDGEIRQLCETLLPDLSRVPGLTVGLHRSLCKQQNIVHDCIDTISEVARELRTCELRRQAVQAELTAVRTLSEQLQAAGSVIPALQKSRVEVSELQSMGQPSFETLPRYLAVLGELTRHVKAVCDGSWRQFPAEARDHIQRSLDSVMTAAQQFLNSVQRFLLLEIRSGMGIGAIQLQKASALLDVTWARWPTPLVYYTAFGESLPSGHTWPNAVPENPAELALSLTPPMAEKVIEALYDAVGFSSEVGPEFEAEFRGNWVQSRSLQLQQTTYPSLMTSLWSASKNRVSDQLSSLVGFFILEQRFNSLKLWPSGQLGQLFGQQAHTHIERLRFAMRAATQVADSVQSIAQYYEPALLHVTARDDGSLLQRGTLPTVGVLLQRIPHAALDAAALFVYSLLTVSRSVQLSSTANDAIDPEYIEQLYTMAMQSELKQQPLTRSEEEIRFLGATVLYVLSLEPSLIPAVLLQPLLTYRDSLVSTHYALATGAPAILDELGKGLQSTTGAYSTILGGLALLAPEWDEAVGFVFMSALSAGTVQLRQGSLATQTRMISLLSNTVTQLGLLGLDTRDPKAYSEQLLQYVREAQPKSGQTVQDAVMSCTRQRKRRTEDTAGQHTGVSPAYVLTALFTLIIPSVWAGYERGVFIGRTLSRLHEVMRKIVTGFTISTHVVTLILLSGISASGLHSSRCFNPDDDGTTHPEVQRDAALNRLRTSPKMPEDQNCTVLLRSIFLQYADGTALEATADVLSEMALTPLLLALSACSLTGSESINTLSSTIDALAAEVPHYPIPMERPSSVDVLDPRQPVRLTTAAVPSSAMYRSVAARFNISQDFSSLLKAASRWLMDQSKRAAGFLGCVLMEVSCRGFGTAPLPHFPSITNSNWANVVGRAMIGMKSLCIVSPDQSQDIFAYIITSMASAIPKLCVAQGSKATFTHFQLLSDGLAKVAKDLEVDAVVKNSPEFQLLQQIPQFIRQYSNGVIGDSQVRTWRLPEEFSLLDKAEITKLLSSLQPAHDEPQIQRKLGALIEALQTPQ